MLLAHETGEGSLSDALVGKMYLINYSMSPPYQESATLAGAITYKQTEPLQFLQEGLHLLDDILEITVNWEHHPFTV